MLDQRRNTFLYEKLAVERTNFRKQFSVDEATFWKILRHISERYEEEKRQVAHDPDKKYRQERLRKVLRYTIQEIVAQSVEEETQQKNLRSALCRICGRSGGNEAYLTWLQPSLPFEPVHR